MIKYFFIIFFLLLTPLCYADYLEITPSAHGFFPVNDDRYLMLNFTNADFVPLGTGFYYVSATETRLYINGTWAHTWEIIAEDYVLLESGDKVLLESGDKIYLE